MGNTDYDRKIQETDSSIFHLSGDANVTSADFGNKAYMLERLFKKGLNVPFSLYLRGSYLENIFIESRKGEYEKLRSGLNEYTLRDGIKEWINGQERNEQLLDILSTFVKGRNDIRFAVRSSSNLEDSDERSYAGVFDTVLNVTTAEEMVDAVRKVFVSRYTYSVDDPDKVTMGIIIQEQVEADYSGVAFSVNPVTGDDEIVLSYAKGACEQVVSGEIGSEIIVEKTGELYDTGCMKGPILTELRDKIFLIENMLDAPVDVEWAVVGDTMYILQARKITAYKKKERISGCNRYIDSMEKETLDELELGIVKASHRKYMEKHYHIRKKALDARIRFPEVGYLFYHSETLNQEVFDQLVPQALIYKVDTEIGTRTLAAADVIPFLKSLENTDGVARLQKITITNACGNASLTESGNIYIEYIPGGFGGYMFGELPYSYYIFSTSGQVLEKYELEYDYLWKFNDIDKKFVYTPCEKQVYSLSNTVIRQLIDIVANCEKVFQNPRIEWELEYDKVYLNDLSFEHTEIDDTVISSKCLSSGELKGEIRVIENFTYIKNILKNRSIVAESSYYVAMRSETFEDFLKTHNIEPDKKYIFVCNYAYPSLSLLINYSCGFIFEKGGVLSHLGIILRENGIPAVIEDGALSKYKDGMYCMENILDYDLSNSATMV